MPSTLDQLTPQQRKDQHYARLAENLFADEHIPREFRDLAQHARVTVRRSGFIDTTRSNQCIVYWMQRAQRGRDNPALDVAIQLGNLLALPVVVVFLVVSDFPGANLRHFAFLQRGLHDVEADCAARNVGFLLRIDTSREQTFADLNGAMVIADENPLRTPEAWRVDLAQRLRIPFWTVDADVIVPAKLLGKAQFSAGVARPRLYRALREFLIGPENPSADVSWKMPRDLHHTSVRSNWTAPWKTLDRTVPPVAAWTGGHAAAIDRLRHFCAAQLATYERDRNHPELDATSGLSPYLHFGHISPVRIALEVDRAAKLHHLKTARDSFFNELIVWRELSVNFVRYNPHYDTPACADKWAQLTLAKHDRDERSATYTRTQLERAETHDELWNAAQMQMVHGGWMHNFMRMYWAKKVVEWTPSAKSAMATLIDLNDKYELDGRDPNGYAGIAWAVLGKFDRAWGERPIWGKRRSMTYESTRRKFNAAAYIAKIRQT